MKIILYFGLILYECVSFYHGSKEYSTLLKLNTFKFFTLSKGVTMQKFYGFTGNGSILKNPNASVLKTFCSIFSVLCVFILEDYKKCKY